MSKDIESQNRLSVEEDMRFSELKVVIAKGLKGFIETALAFAEISDRRLYRAQYSSFEEFCQSEYEKPAQEVFKRSEATAKKRKKK